MAFAYKNQIFFTIVFGILIYLGFQEDNTSSINYKRGILAAFLACIAQGCMKQYTGPFIKGFEIFWRGLSRYAIIYLVILIFILYQKKDDARQLLKYLDPNLGTNLPQINIDTSCDYFNLWENIDRNYAMLFSGWFFVTLMIRDPYFLYFLNLFDQALRYSWQRISGSVYDFRGCWQEHIIVDIVCCKTLAIILGMVFVKKIGLLRELDWFGRKGKYNIKEWDFLHNHRRFGCLCVLFLISIARFLSGSMMKDTLWIPPRGHFIHFYRHSVWLALGAMAVGELHDDIETWGTEKRRKTPISNEYRWIVSGIMVLEIAISWKFDGIKNVLENPLVLEKSLLWIIFSAILIVYYLYLRFKKDRVTKYGKTATVSQTQKEKENIVSEVQQKSAKKTTNNGNSEEKLHPGPKTKKQVEPAPVQTEVAEAGKKSKKGKAGEKTELGIQEIPAQVQAPEEDEWRVVAGNRPIRRKGKNKKS